jgi:phenylacetate-CoA ligase
MSMLQTLYYLQEMRINQRRSRQDIEQLQFKRLKRIVDHAYLTVPYYHDLFKKNNLHPKDIKKISDIEKIPVTTKQDIINNFPSRILSTSIGEKYSVEHTSGSTGLSLSVARSPLTKSYELALVMHPLFEDGLTVTDKLLTIEDPRHFGDEKKSLLNRAGLLRKEKASVFDDSLALFNKINSASPDVIYGMPSSLFLIARLMKEKGLELEKKPKFIVSTSETLYGKHRELIENSFGAKVFDHYGSTEFPRISWQDRESEHLHINSDSHVVEFLRDGESVVGEQGLVTVTSLYNFGMPFLRYSLNDVSESVLGDCACGRNLPLMKSIEGRKDDFVLDDDGRAISPKVFSYEFDELKGLKEYTVVQTLKGKITLNFVEGEDFDKKELDLAVARLNKWCNNRLSVRLVKKKSILRTGKKLRRVISHIKPRF